MIQALDYKGKVCVVTGGTDGTSKAIIESLVIMGAEVYTLDIYECKVPGIKGYISCDLANSMDIDNAFNYLPKQIDAFFGVSELSGVNLKSIAAYEQNPFKLNAASATTVLDLADSLGVEMEDLMQDIR